MTCEYILQVLSLLSLLALPFALSKKSIKRTHRLALAMCPVVIGVAYALAFKGNNGIFIALIGLWGVLFVMFSRRKENHD